MKKLLPLLGVLVLLPTLACSDAEGPDTVAGTYTLQTVDGHPLPAIVSGAQVISGGVVLRADATFEDRLSVGGEADGAARVEAATGRWSQTAGEIRFHATSPAQVDYTMVLSGHALTQLDVAASFPGQHVFVSVK